MENSKWWSCKHLYLNVLIIFLLFNAIFLLLFFLSFYLNFDILNISLKKIRYFHAYQKLSYDFNDFRNANYYLFKRLLFDKLIFRYLKVF